MGMDSPSFLDRLEADTQELYRKYAASLNTEPVIDNRDPMWRAELERPQATLRAVAFGASGAGQGIPNSPGDGSSLRIGGSEVPNPAITVPTPTMPNLHGTNSRSVGSPRSPGSRVKFEHGDSPSTSRRLFAELSTNSPARGHDDNQLNSTAPASVGSGRIPVQVDGSETRFYPTVGSPIDHKTKEYFSPKGISMLELQHSIDLGGSPNVKYKTTGANRALQESSAKEDGFVDTGSIEDVFFSPPEAIEARCIYFLDHLRSSRAEVRKAALIELNKIARSNPPVLPRLVQGLLESLDNSRFHDYEYNMLLLNTLSVMGPSAVSALSALMSILRDKTQARLRDSVIETILSLGLDGVEHLMDVALLEIPPLAADVLVKVANHPQIQSEVIVPLLMQDIGSKRPEDLERRESAVLSLGHLGRSARRALPLLIDLLLAGVLDRPLLAWAISMIEPEGEFDLIQLLQTSNNSRVRAVSARALGEPRLVNPPPLKVVVKGVTGASARFSVTPTPPATIFSYSFDDYNTAKNESVRKRRLQHVTIEAGELVACVRRRLQDNAEFEAINEEDRMVSETPHDIPREHTDIAVRALTGSLSDPDPSVRESAAESLGMVGAPKGLMAVSALCHNLGDENNKVREKSVKALGQLGPEAGVSTLSQTIALLKDEFWKVRYNACVALGRYGGVSGHAIPYLAKVLRDGTVQRKEAAAALAGIGEQGEECLMQIISKEVQNNCQMIVAAAYGLSCADLQSPGLERVADVLFRASRDHLPLVRRASLEALCSIGKRAKDTIPYLKARTLLPFFYGNLKEREKTVRDGAAEMLANWGPHGELLLIEGLLKDNNPTVRAASAHGLCCVGAQSVRTLMLALNDKETSVRKAVAAAIEAIGLSGLVNTLRKRNKSQRDSVVLSARSILETSGYTYSHSLVSLLRGLVAKVEAMPAEPDLY